MDPSPPAHVNFRFWGQKLRQTEFPGTPVWQGILSPGDAPITGCARLASPGRPRCGGVFFFQDERVQIITHVRPGKKPATHRG